MGLELVEIAMATEERFGIRIADEEFEHIRTVADLARVAHSKIPARDAEKICPNVIVFNKIRRKLMDEFGVVRSAVRPEVPLETLIPIDGRIDRWKRFGDSTNLQFPDLVLPKLLETRIAGVAFAVGLLVLAIGSLFVFEVGELIGLYVFLLIMASILAGTVTFTLLLRAFKNSADQFPENLRSVADFVRYTLTLNSIALIESGYSPDEQESIQIVREIVSGQLALPLDQVQPESKLLDLAPDG